jgi:hypothetical protein
MAQKRGRSAKLWSLRALSLTDSIIVDSLALASFDRALLFARLGEAWWKDDPERAKVWLKKAVRELDYASTGTVDAQHQKLFTARALLAIIAPRDRELSVRLANMFMSESGQLPDDEREQNAEALLDAALAVVDNDPDRAARLGAASIRNGRTRQLVDLLERLSSRDPRLGAALFSEAVAVGRASSDANLFLQLGQVAFPNGQDASSPIPVEAQTLLLASLEQEFLSHTAEPGKDANCKFAWIIAPLVGQYERLLPQHTPLVRTALVRCQASLDSLSRSRVDEGLGEKPAKSVEDLLKEAEGAVDPKVRTFQLARAASMAAQQHDYDRAIDILDTISSEGRELIKGAWNGGRWDYAARSAFAHAKSGDYAGMRKVIAETPVDLRPLTLIDVAEKLATDGDQIVAIELAHEARRTLEKADVGESERVATRISLVRLFGRLAPADAPLALQEMVETMNRETQPEQVKGERFGVDPRDALLLAPIILPISLLELDDLGVQQTASSIKPPISRVRVRLGFLASSLEKMRAVAPGKNKVAL